MIIEPLQPEYAPLRGPELSNQDTIVIVDTPAKDICKDGVI